jgi:hypothetical protein
VSRRQRDGAFSVLVITSAILGFTSGSYGVVGVVRTPGGILTGVAWLTALFILLLFGQFHQWPRE